MRLGSIAALICAAHLMHAQSGMVTISDTIRQLDGSLFQGSVSVTLRYSGPLLSPLGTLAAGTRTVTVRDGAFTLAIVPNSSIQPPGTSYSVRMMPERGVAWTETWIVPSSPATTTIAAVRVTSAPAPVLMISPQQISTAGAQPGQSLTFDGASVNWSFGATAWGAISGTISNQTDLWNVLQGKAPASHTHILGEVLQSGAAVGQVPQWDGTAWSPATITGNVVSVFGRAGSVTAQAGDYTASQITNTPSGGIGATTVQAALNELDAEKAQTAHNHDASDVTSGVFGTARLGSGSATSSTFLRGDSTWAAVAWTDVSGKPSTFPPASHTHAAADLTASGASPGQVLKWNGSAWTPAADETGGVVNYSQPFTSQTSVALTHNGGTTAVVTACYDASNVEIVPQSVAVTNANTVTVTFGQATSGYCVVNTSGGGGGGGVTSVGLSMPAGFSVSGSPVTSSGTLTVTTALSGVVRASGGAFATVSGNASDCVRVDGTSGPCGSGSVYTGAGLTGDGTQSNPVRVDPAGAVASQAYYVAGLDFALIGAGSCAELNIAAAGASAGVTVAPGWPATLPQGLVGMMYGGTGVVVVRLCNVTGAAIDPPSATYSARIVGGF